MNPEEQRTSCPGFLDDYGVWNNGFECPPLAGQVRICCGSESRRFCCTLDTQSKQIESLSNRPVSYSTMDTSLFLSDRKSSSLFSTPILLTCFVGLIFILFVLIVSLCLWSRYRRRKFEKRKENHTTKTTLLTDHFPFSPPHHQLFLNDTPSPYHPNKDTMTTTTLAPSTTATSTSSSSGRVPSDIYFNDWKDFLIAGEQPMNLYPTMSSYSNELIHDPISSSSHSNYFFHGKRQHHDVIV